jgi:hypothetical protein
MKKTLALLLLAALSTQLSFAQESNYILIINGDSISINLNKEYNHKLKKDNFTFKLIQPNNLVYANDVITFKYPNNLSVSETPVEEGIKQIMVMTATGCGAMVQTYDGFNPEGLVSLMMNEITKESISYGYTKNEEDIQFNAKSGELLKGIKTTLEYKGEKEIYTVTAYGEKDEGILVITIMQGEDAQGEEMINTFINSFSLKSKEN